MKPACQYLHYAQTGAQRLPLRRAMLLSAALMLGGCAALVPTGERAAVVTSESGATPAFSLRPDQLTSSRRVASATTEAGKATVPDPLPGTPLDPTNLTRTQRLFETARAAVASFTGAALDHVRLELVSDRAIDQVVATETRHLVDAQFSDAPFRERLLTSIMHSQRGSYAALYADERATVMISENQLEGYMKSLLATEGTQVTANELQDQALLALLVHELVHAADDTRHSIHANRTLTFRASFAQSAVFEGHAQWVTRQICEREGCSEGLAALDRFMFAVGTPLKGQARSASNQAFQSRSVKARSVSATSRNVLEYSYVEGERFIRELAARDNGRALIEQALDAPPVDPIQILDPRTFPDLAREERNRKLLDVSAGLDHPWQRAPWASVETSPLKGINLRAEPENRAVAVDGFTRLITAMVAVQFYDQSHPQRPPVEVTLIGTDTDATAALFASIMHENARPDSLRERRERITLRAFNGELMNAAVYAAFESAAAGRPEAAFEPEAAPPTGRSGTAQGPATDYASLTATTGRHVVQLAGYADISTLRDYALKFLTQAERAELVEEPLPFPARTTLLLQPRKCC